MCYHIINGATDMPNEMHATMSATEAISFDTMSTANAALVEAGLDRENGCECEPYLDVFTMTRWNAQRFKIIRGSTGIKISVMKRGRGKKITDPSDPDYGKVKPGRMYPSGTSVFCRCQVEPFPPGWKPRKRGRRRAAP